MVCGIGINYLFKMRILLIFLSCTLWYVGAEQNLCCPNNDALLETYICPKSEESWIKDCPHGAYSIISEEYEINHDNDSLRILNGIDVNIPSDKYCLGRMENNEKVAMICFTNVSEEMPEGQMSYLARLICTIISIICLALTLIVYIMLPNLRDLQGKCMMFTIFNLLMGFFFLALIQHFVTEVTDLGCEILASLLYFWFMSVFSWLNVVSFNVWRSIVRPKLSSNKNKLFLLYNAYGWGISFLFLIIVLICHKVPGNHIKPKLGESSCWFSDSAGLRAFFYGPISVLIIFNIIMFVSIAWTLSNIKSHIIDRRRRSHVFKFGLYLKLFIIMGICWIFEPLSELFYREGSYVWLITDYINSLQGLIIFLLLIVFRQRVRRDLARRRVVCCSTLTNQWAAIPDEDIDELEEHIDELESSNDNNMTLN